MPGKRQINKLKSISVIILILFLNNNVRAGFAQNIDSLKQELAKPNLKDTVKVNLLIESGWYYIYHSDHQTSLDYLKAAYDLSRKIKFIRGIYRSCFALGNAHKELGQYDVALEYHLKSLALLKRLKLVDRLAGAYNGIGDVYNNQGNYKDALSNFLLSLEMYEKAKNIGGMAWAHSNIGVVLTNQNDADGAIEHYLLAIKLAREKDDKKSAAWFNNNLGNSYMAKKEYGKALDCFHSALSDGMATNTTGASLAFTYNSIGMVNYKLNKLPEALINLNKALEIRKEVGDMNGVSWSLNDIGMVLTDQKNYKKAIEHYNEALKVALEIKSLERIRNAYESLARLYALERDFQKAFENHKLYMKFKDSLFNETTHLQVQELNTKYETEQKDAELKIVNKEKKLTELQNEKNKMEIRNHRIQRTYFIVGLVLLIGLAFFIYNRFKISQKQKKIIEQKEKETLLQKEVIEEKQKEIIDSINYAKRIQNTLLAHSNFLNENLPGNFVYFNPKDIVSGDFYWAAKKDERFYLAVCDSTGHGVPGAFMSLLNIGFLSEAIKEKGIKTPNEILNFVRERLIENISKEGQKDGFDGILICIDQKTNKISYAAANNAPVIIRKNKLEELECDRMPVGMGEKKEDFKLYSMDVESGDLVYLYTDGFADQFGGPKGKKFKYKQLNELILANCDKPISEQGKNLKQMFNEWRGNLEQVDDVCVIGIKIS